MTALHQIIALERARKSHAKAAGDAIYQRLQKHQLASGGYGNYTPADEATDLPLQPERQAVQNHAEKLLADYAASQAPAWDITATKDAGNTRAAADVKADGSVILAKVPATTLIFLEKQLTDLRTVISKAPVLDPGENWHLDQASGLYSTDPVETVRTKKVVRHDVVVPATDKFPAQVAETSQDVVAGTWSRVKQSGALPATRQEQLLGRVNQLIEAVKTAREEANSTDTDSREIAAPVFSWVLRP